MEVFTQDGKGNKPLTAHYYMHYWANMSELHASAFNVEFCLYGTYIHWTVHHSQLSWSLVLCVATKCAIYHVPFYVSFVEQVWRACLSDADGKGWLLRL